MITRVCTGWSPSGRLQYGERFLASFDANWPLDVQLQAYVEEPHEMPRNACRSLWDIPGALAFADRYRDDPVANGIEPREGWKQSDRRNRYSFRFDAFKFFKQILIPQQAALGLKDGDILIWIDGDVVATRPIPLGFAEKLLGDADVMFLNREPKHSEIGFWGVRLNERTGEFLSRIAHAYTSDEFKALGQWHSAFVWDACRRISGLKERHLCPPGSRGHVFPISPLAPYLRHDKGPRKGKGK